MSTAGGVLSPVREGVVPGCLRGGASSHCSQESILIYLTLSGSVIPMRVMESDSIASVKLRIQSYQGFMVKKQKLVYGGRELARNDSLVRDYGLTDGNILHLVIRLSDLRFIIVQTACGKEFKFHVDKSRNVGYVKQQIAKKGNNYIDINNQELICDGEKLDDEKVINDLCRKNDAVIHLLVRKSAKVRAKPVEKDFELSIITSHLDGGSVREQRKEEVRKWSGDVENLLLVQKEPPDRVVCLEPVIINQKIELPGVARDLIKATFAGLENGNNPVRSSEGCGGAYFMQDFSGKKYVAVFKPMDEEPMAVNNPHGLPLTSDGEGLKRGTKVGEGALREVAAFLLDHPKSGRRSFTSDEIGFAGVPPTVLIRCLHEAFNHPHGFERSEKYVKIGSLQMFVKNGGSCEDMGPQAFPVEEVHKISVLDVRLANADRHAGNILICREGKDAPIKLVPIDHGYCLPENFEDCTFEWLYWPQSRQPFSPETIEYIRSLDAEQDIALLKFHGWELSLECSRTLRISTMLLKKGAERGFTPFDIASVMCRETLKKESIIEEIVHEAHRAVLPETSEAAFLESVSQVMDCRLDELKQHR